MKTLLYMFVIALVLFISVPAIYGIGSMVVDMWCDMLPYDWTHTSSHKLHGRAHF